MSINSIVSNPTILKELSDELSEWKVISNNIQILPNDSTFTLSVNGSLCMLSCNNWYSFINPVSSQSQTILLIPPIPLEYIPLGATNNNLCNTPAFLGLESAEFSVQCVVGISTNGNLILHFPGSIPSSGAVGLAFPTLIWNYKILILP
jgi:hypothetical protein